MLVDLFLGLPETYYSSQDVSPQIRVLNILPMNSAVVMAVMSNVRVGLIVLQCDCCDAFELVLAASSLVLVAIRRLQTRLLQLLLQLKRIFFRLAAFCTAIDFVVDFDG